MALPTGAGKTALQDVLRAALYAKTPCLSGTRNSHPDNMLSPSKDEGHTEVTFEANDRCHPSE